MMVPLLLSLKMCQPHHGIPMERFYRYVGISRQGFYQKVKREEELLLTLSSMTDQVLLYRQEKDRRAGLRSIFYNIDIKSQYQLGVNKFENLMSTQGLSLRPLRTRVITTKSSKQSWNYRNLINGLTITNINKVVVGDLTYLSLNGHRYYLFCLIDIYSARIVGHHLDKRMRANEAKKTLDMWKRLRKEGLKGCIHHTDGGSQYFSELYLKALDDLDTSVSCAENCLMNGYAEQRNGLIKHHLLPTMEKSGSLAQLQQEMSRVINFYNHKRKQKELGWLSPVNFEKKITTLTPRPRIKLYKYDKEKNGFF